MKMRAMGLRISCPLMGMGVGAGKGFESPPRPWGVLSFCSYPHVTVEETEAHRGLITHSPKTTYMPHSGHSQDLTPRSSWSQSLRVRQSKGESPCQSPGQLPQCPAPRGASLGLSAQPVLSAACDSKFMYQHHDEEIKYLLAGKVLSS